MPSSLLSSTQLLAQNVPPKAGTPGVAQDSTPPSTSGSQSGSAAPPFGGFLMPLLMIAVFIPFFLLMSRRQKKEQAARSSLKKGDKVMANSGLIGELMEMDDRIAKMKIAPGVVVQVVANTVSPLTLDADKSAAASKELKEAKAGSDKK